MSDVLRFLWPAAALAALFCAPPSLAAREVTGPIVALSDHAITVHGRWGDLTCRIATASPRPRNVRVGDTVLAACVTGDDRDAGEPAWVLGAISGKNGTPGPGRYTFARDGVDVVEGVVVGGESTSRGRTATGVTVRPLNGATAVHCAWPFAAPPPATSILRLGCRGGVALGVDRAAALDGKTTTLSATVVASRPLLRVALRYGGVASCGYGELSADASDFPAGASVRFICDRGSVGELTFLRTRDMVWSNGADASLSGDERSVAIADQNFEHATCAVNSLNPERTLPTAFTCVHGVYVEPSPDVSYPNGFVTAIAPGALTLRTIRGTSVTVRIWSKLGLMVDATQLAEGTPAIDVLHVGDLVHTMTAETGPSPLDIVAVGVQKLSKGCGYEFVCGTTPRP